MRTAWEWAVVNSRLDDISPAADTLEMFFRFGGLPAEGQCPVCGRSGSTAGTDRSGRLSPAVALAGYLPAVAARGAVAGADRPGGGAGAAVRARARWAALGNDRRLAQVLIDMAYVNMRLSRPTVAGPWPRRRWHGRGRWAMIGSHRRGLYNLGNAANWLGDTVGGRMLLERKHQPLSRGGRVALARGALSDIRMAIRWRRSGERQGRVPA